MKMIVSIVLGILPVVVCSCQKKEPEMIRLIIQPEVEINKQMDFEILVNGMPDEGSLQIDSISGLKIQTADVTIQENGDGYSFKTYAIPTKLGIVEVPPVSVKINSTEYKSKPFSFKVVDNITIHPNAVRTVLVSDKSTYRLQDTIRLSLYQYSRFSNTNRYTPEITVPNGISMSGEGSEIKVETELSLYGISGIRGFDEYLEENFEVTGFDINPFDHNQVMGHLDNEEYIKTEIFTLHLLARKKSEYQFRPSIFEYLVYKNNDDFFSKYTSTGEETYMVTDRGSVKLEVTSNKVKIKVK